MVKKIMKYAKFVVCCALIVSLIAPSYAALSASDGSAFVTKAEFDAALADFNSRLTTFEAGINSKIDSQVTSYLDRNGIWNGKAQTLLHADGVWTLSSYERIAANEVAGSFEFYNDSSSRGIIYKLPAGGMFSDHTVYTATQDVAPANNTVAVAYAPVVASINKSGMLVGSFATTQMSSGNWYAANTDSAVFLGVGLVICPQRKNPIEYAVQLGAGVCGNGSSSSPYSFLYTTIYYSTVNIYNMFTSLNACAKHEITTKDVYNIMGSDWVDRSWYQPAGTGFSFVSKGQSLWILFIGRKAFTGYQGKIKKTFKVENVVVY